MGWNWTGNRFSTPEHSQDPVSGSRSGKMLQRLPADGVAQGAEDLVAGFQCLCQNVEACDHCQVGTSRVWPGQEQGY